jgi:hypothetical protein
MHMKKVHFLALATFALLIFSCSDKKASVITFKGDIEGGDWINSNTIGKFGGYTGEYCSKADSTNQYSYGLRKSTSEISPDPINKVKISVWVKLEDLVKKTYLVVSVSDNDKKNLFWIGHEINPVVKEANKWYKFESEDIIPEGAQIETYLYNSNKNVAYVDDFEIIFSGE